MAAALFFKHRRLILVLSRQYGGKTELGCRLGIDITGRPDTKSSLFLAKDHPSAKKATREKFLRLADPKKFRVNTQQIVSKKCETSALFIGSVDKEPDRLRGGTYAYVHWSEVAFSKIDKGETITGVFEKVVKPTLSLRDGYVLLETTLKGKNEFYDLYNDAKAHRMHILHLGLSKMVEMGLVTREVYEYEKSQYHPDVFRQEFDCEWVSFLGRAYPEFTDRHIDPNMPEPEQWQNLLVAIDWGFRPSATCVLFAYVLNGVLNIYDEHYEMEETPIETSAAIERRRIRHGGQTTCVADHDPARIVELTRRGIPCANADKTNVMGARMQIKEALYFDKVKIHPRCEMVIRDLAAAAWDDKKDGEIDYSQCSWGHMDGESALRYLIRMLDESENDEPESDSLAMFDSVTESAYGSKRLPEWRG
jgi:phage terminase large subunit